MNILARIAELVELLEWAIDVIDMYDELLASIDGREKVYTPVHAGMKRRIRRLLKEYQDKSIA